MANETSSEARQYTIRIPDNPDSVVVVQLPGGLSVQVGDTEVTLDRNGSSVLTLTGDTDGVESNGIGIQSRAGYVIVYEDGLPIEPYQGPPQGPADYAPDPFDNGPGDSEPGNVTLPEPVDDVTLPEPEGIPPEPAPGDLPPPIDPQPPAGDGGSAGSDAGSSNGASAGTDGGSTNGGGVDARANGSASSDVAASSSPVADPGPGAPRGGALTPVGRTRPRGGVQPGVVDAGDGATVAVGHYTPRATNQRSTPSARPSGGVRPGAIDPGEQANGVGEGLGGPRGRNIPEARTAGARRGSTVLDPDLRR